MTFRTAASESLAAALERHRSAREALAKASHRVAAPPFALPRVEALAAPAQVDDEPALQALRERAERESAELEDATRRLLEWRTTRRERADATSATRMALAQQRQRRQLRRIIVGVVVLGMLPFIDRLLWIAVTIVSLAVLAIYDVRERSRLRARCPGCDEERPTPKGVLECASCGITVR